MILRVKKDYYWKYQPSIFQLPKLSGFFRIFWKKVRLSY